MLPTCSYWWVFDHKTVLLYVCFQKDHDLHSLYMWRNSRDPETHMDCFNIFTRVIQYKKEKSFNQIAITLHSGKKQKQKKQKGKIIPPFKCSSLLRKAEEKSGLQLLSHHTWKVQRGLCQESSTPLAQNLCGSAWRVLDERSFNLCRWYLHCCMN